MLVVFLLLYFLNPNESLCLIVPLMAIKSCIPLTFMGKPTAASPAAKPPPTATPAPYPLDHLVLGYPRLAGRMALFPQTAMFRRFGALNARNLLYLQSDLMALEQELERLELEDSKSGTGKKNMYTRDSFWITRACIPRDGDTKQRDKVLEMRALLQEYSQFSPL